MVPSSWIRRSSIWSWMSTLHWRGIIRDRWMVCIKVLDQRVMSIEDLECFSASHIWTPIPGTLVSRTPSKHHRYKPPRITWNFENAHCFWQSYVLCFCHHTFTPWPIRDAWVQQEILSSSNSDRLVHLPLLNCYQLQIVNLLLWFSLNPLPLQYQHNTAIIKLLTLPCSTHCPRLPLQMFHPRQVVSVVLVMFLTVLPPPKGPCELFLRS